MTITLLHRQGVCDNEQRHPLRWCWTALQDLSRKPANAVLLHEKPETTFESEQLQNDFSALMLKEDINGAWRLLNSTIRAVAADVGLLSMTAERCWQPPPDTRELQAQHHRVRVQLALVSTQALLRICRCWHLIAHATRLNKLLSARRRRDARVRRLHLAERICQAADSGDSHCAFRMARLLASSKLCSRGRMYGRLPSSVPELDSWATHVAGRGRDGGCQARILMQATGLPSTRFLNNMYEQAFGQAYSPAPPLEFAGQDLARLDLEGIRMELRRRRKSQAVPPWSLPTWIWSEILNPRDKRFEGSNVTQNLFWILQLIRSSNTLPACWLTAQSIPIPRQSPGRVGPRAYRVISLLEPLSKCFAAQLWRHNRGHSSVDSPWSFGLAVGRSREEAHFALQGTLHRLRKSQTGLRRD